MSIPRKEKKAERALDRARKHQSVRSRWADRLVRSGVYSHIVLATNITLLALPFCLIVALGIGTYDLSEASQATKQLLWWAGATVAVLPILLLVSGLSFIRVLGKRSFCSISTSEAGVILSYLPNCPELLAIVQEWVVNSGDANLSAYEYGLIYNVASAAELKMAGNVPDSTTLMDMNEDFYRLFPHAPRFSISEKQHEREREKEEYLRQVFMLDQRIDHIERAKIKDHMTNS